MSTEFDDVVRALLTARTTGGVAPAAPFVDAVPDAESAYAVQTLVASALGWHGDQPGRHWKSGGAARDAVITHAALPPKGIWQSPADVVDWPLHLHGVEAEIALRLGCDVTPAMAQKADQAMAQAWVSDMTVAIEVIDTRWDLGYDTPAWLKLADLQAHGGLVLSEWLPWRDLDWTTQRFDIKINSKVVDARTGTHPLGHPTWGLPAFVRHATRTGQTLAAGCIVTTGSWNGVYRAAPGDHAVVSFADVGEASVQF